MQIILLSGGSGKRLWPLSNDARSKQFLPLLTAPDGGMESMLQRVVRQIGEAGLDGKITLATNQSQRDIIINQLGEEIDCVNEPERRDTFPAIALSAAYLAYSKKLPADEVVVVMPCDPYTEAGYFRTLARMADYVKAGVADLVLMGIKPSEASQKFGYIIPAGAADGSDSDVLKVASFTEKPDKARAEELLKQGALWNGGVFAFKLGYLTGILSRYTASKDFEQIYAHYSELPKISFDYEVVEKAESVACVVYDGSWKDLGTWNALCGELKFPAMGNALLSEDAHNSNVINELDIPLCCCGVSDVVVAASPDGILVASKDSTEGIKKFAEKLSDRPLFEERRWGRYKVTSRATYPDGYKSLTKSLTIFPGKNISYQLHRHRAEVWTFVDGEGLLVLDGQVRKVRRGDVIDIKIGQKHAVRALTRLEFLEVQMGDLLEETDIERYDWDWAQWLD